MKKINREIFQKILERYFKHHEGSTTLAKVYGLNPTTVQKWLHVSGNRKKEVQDLIKLKNWNLLKARKEVQRRAADLRGQKFRKKITLRFGESFAYVLGVLCGDGHVGKRFVSLECEDENFARTFSKEGEQAFGIKASFGKRKKTGLYRVVFWSKELATKLRSAYKTGTKEWTVPKEIMRGNKKLKIGFLRGFVDSEGYVGLSLTKSYYASKSGENRICLSLQGYVNLSSTNEKGIRQVSSLLKDLGIKVHLYSINGRREWRICTVKNKSNLQLFKELIDFRTIRDRERLKFLISNINHSPNRWGWSGPLHCLPKRCLELMKQDRPKKVVLLDRQNMPQK